MKKLFLFSLLIFSFSLFPNISSAGYYDCGYGTTSWRSHVPMTDAPNSDCNNANGYYEDMVYWPTTPDSTEANGIIGMSVKDFCGYYYWWSCSYIEQNDASCTSMSAPTSVVAGSTFTGTVTMYNNGDKTWTTALKYNLGSQSPNNNSTWGTNRHALPATVAPDSSTVFSFNNTAPATPGTYGFGWGMVQDGVEWFGSSCTQNITVTAPPPTNVTGKPISCGGKVEISWDASAGATSYDIYRQAGISKILVGNTTDTKITISVTKISGIFYPSTYFVRAKNSAAVSGYSLGTGLITPSGDCGTWTAPTCPSACGTAPSNPPYTCVGGSGSCATNVPATLACAATAACPAPTCTGVTFPACITPGTNFTVSVNGTSDTTEVRFPTWSLYNGQDDINWYLDSTNPFAMTIPQSSHTGGTGEIATHVYIYNAAYPGGVFCGGQTMLLCAVPPTTVTATPVAACGSGQVDLSWSAVTGATGYDTQIDGGAWTNRNNVTSYSYTGLGNSTAHTFAVRAWNASGAGAGKTSSPASVTTVATCVVPSLTFTADSLNIPYNSSTTLRWTPGASTWCWGGPWNPTADWKNSTGGSESTGNLITSQTYTLTCGNALDQDVGKSVTINVGALPVPVPPTTVTATPVAACGSGQVDLSWSAVAGATGYNTQIDGGAWTSRGNVTSYSYTTLGNSTAHTFAVQAWNASGAGTGKASSPASVTTAVVCSCTSQVVGSNCSVPTKNIGETTAGVCTTGAGTCSYTCLAGNTWGAPLSYACTVIPPPPVITAPAFGNHKRIMVPYPTNVDLGLDLMGATVACTLTKVPLSHPNATPISLLSGISTSTSKTVRVTANSIYKLTCDTKSDTLIIEILSGEYES